MKRMPVLQREPNIWPDGLFAELAEASSDVLPWWVLHTRARTEKLVARLLCRAGVSFFLPLYERVRKICAQLLLAFTLKTDLHDLTCLTAARTGKSETQCGQTCGTVL